MQKELKTALVIGGNGALGKQVIKTFQTLKPFWRIFSIDLTINKEADKNIIIGKNFDKSSIPDIKKSIESNFDCIINVAGGWSGDNLNNEDILVSTQLMHHQNVTSSVLSTYLARNYLNKKGLLIFTGAAAVYDNQNTNMLAYQLAKNSVHYLTELLVQNPQELPEDTKIITLLPTIIDTSANREAMKNADYSKWTPPEKIAETIKEWADTKKYPTDNFYRI